MHGVGSARFASIVASPAVVAGAGSVTRLTPVVGEAGVRQLTTPRKAATGFTPVATITSPSTLISFSSPLAEASCQGTPPPLMPRTGLAAPVNGETTGRSEERRV